MPEHDDGIEPGGGVYVHIEGSEPRHMRESDGIRELRDEQAKTGAMAWFRRYFCEGQDLVGFETASDVEISEADSKNVGGPAQTSWRWRHRRVLSMAIPALAFHSFWWPYMASGNRFHIFTERVMGTPRYYMSITMLFGSMVAGATTEGGASVAFPVMTLAFQIAPMVARDFSLMVQSFGMIAAAFSIFYMRVRVETTSLLWGSLGGAVGVIVGIEWVAPVLPPNYTVMYFVSVWAAFAFSLYLLNRDAQRCVVPAISVVTWRTRVALVCAGLAGGVLTGLTGSGVNICVFAVNTLIFRVSEKVATPTSVLLLAGNTVVGFAWRQLAQGGVAREAWGFLLVCIPIVVLGAPLGSVLGSHFHRLTLAAFVYVMDAVQLLSAFIIVKQTPVLATTSVCATIVGCIVFELMSRCGRPKLEAEHAQSRVLAGISHDNST